MDRIGGAYWAARAYIKAGDKDKVRPMLASAAAWPRTFYGLLAGRALGHRPAFDWNVPLYTNERATLLKPQPAFQRAAALQAIGQTRLAEQQLLTINPGSDADLREAVIAYALHAGMPALAMRLAGIYQRADGRFYDAALYPLPPWKAEKAGRVDTALLLALIRQESGFDAQATSGRGAVGLMQVMPETANEVAINSGAALKDPQVNLAVGRKYIDTLLAADEVGAQLMPLLVAYNAGPGNLTKWKQQYADTLSDPLLFIESVPVVETRAYVEHVMANDWIYRQRLGLPTPLLDSAARGRWALNPSPAPLPPAQPARTAKPVRIADAKAASSH